MELNLYFSGLVLLVCAVHLATVAGQAVEDLARALSGEKKILNAQPQERDDWYVFFCCADLLGTASVNRVSRGEEQRQVACPPDDAIGQDKRRPARMRGGI